MIWIDVARAIGIFAVVIGHICSEYNYRIKGMLYVPEWWAGMIYNLLIPWCVPLFVMISGLLLLDPSKETNLGTFYRKRALRILVPLVFWTCFYLLWRYIKGIYIGPEVPLRFYLIDVYRGEPYYHMWYVYMIVGLYFFTPFIKIAINKIEMREVKYLTIVVSAMVAITIIRRYFSDLPDTMFFFNKFLLYLPFYLAGYYIANTTFSVRNSLYVLAFFAVLPVSVICCYIFSKSYGYIALRYFAEPLSINSMMMGAFLLIRMKTISKPLISEKFTKTIAKLTFGIYLIHPIFIELLDFAGLRVESFNPFISIPVIAVVVFALSTIVVLGMSKVPYLRRTVS